MTKLYEMVKEYTNREIKFRGKLKTTGEWVYGDLVRLQDGENTITAIYYKGEVEPKSVGQFTGFTDKNGKEIYEGDIVERYDEYYVVEFNIKRRGYYPFACGDGCGCCEYKTMSPEDVEVVGNIYDDEELVKEHNL